MNVGWQDCETGAPEIDPKRPYGNSAVYNDMYEILSGESIGLVDSKRDALTPTEEQFFFDLHRETEEALQVVLATGSFLPGIYESSKYGNGWKLIELLATSPNKQ